MKRTGQDRLSAEHPLDHLLWRTIHGQEAVVQIPVNPPHQQVVTIMGNNPERSHGFVTRDVESSDLGAVELLHKTAGVEYLGHLAYIKAPLAQEVERKRSAHCSDIERLDFIR